MTRSYYRWHVTRLLIYLSLYTATFAFAPTKLHNNQLCRHHHHYRHHFISSLKEGSDDGRPYHLQIFSTSGSSDIAVVNNSFADKNNINNNKDINLQPTKPRLVSLLETAIKWCTKYIFLKQCATISVNINATSNRALLKGKINAFSISMRDCMFRFNMLSFKKLDISAGNLHLGHMPFILPLLPFLLWRMRSYIWTAFVSVFILQMTGYIEPTALSQIYQRVKQRMYNIMGARSSTINYSMAISQENITNSIVLKFWLKGILRSLVDNSVVGAAAVFGDVQKEVDSEIRRQAASDRRAVPLLPSSSDGSSISAPSPQSDQQQGITSALLSATNFELHNTMFQDNRIVLEATAVVPEKASSSRRYPFTIRAKGIPTTVINGQLIENGDKYNALGFASPECRLNSTPLTAGTILGKLLPDVLWIPFGAGVAVQLGKSNCRIYRADISNDTCRLDGSFTMFAPPRDGSTRW